MAFWSLYWELRKYFMSCFIVYFVDIEQVLKKDVVYLVCKQSFPWK